MPVLMMHIRYVRVRVPKRTVSVRMRMRFANWVFSIVAMLVVLVMQVGMRVL